MKSFRSVGSSFTFFGRCKLFGLWGHVRLDSRLARFAVILPNFRITPGFGGKLFYSGFGSYGRKMLEDHEDAVKWAIEQGFVDPKRVCTGWIARCALPEIRRRPLS